MTAPAPAVQSTVCPTCLNPVDGLLAGCDRAECITAELDYDAALERLLDS
ncbi:hypothetical protein ACH4T9_12350 [Micromonospora sp. NPDC020750]